MLLLNQLFKFLKLLHSEVGTRQLSAGFVLGMFLGFTPPLTLQWPLFWLILFLFRINIGAAFISYAGFAILSFALDPLFHQCGLWALTEVPALRPLWVQFSLAPLLPYTRFNNTIVLGSFLWALVLSVPLFFLSGILVRRYRETVVARFKATTLFRIWSTSKLYNLYEKYEQLKS